MVFYAAAAEEEEESSSSCSSDSSKEAFLKSSLSRMKTLFCKDIDPHLRKIKSPPASKKAIPPIDDPSSKGRWPLQDSPQHPQHHQQQSPQPSSEVDSSALSPKKSGKENLLSKDAKDEKGSRRRRGRKKGSTLKKSPPPAPKSKAKSSSSSSSSSSSTKSHRKSTLESSHSFTSIKPFRKSPAKFDPSRLSIPSDDPLPTSTDNHHVKKAKSVKKKLDLDSSTGCPPLHTIIPGDYLSHPREYYHVQTNGKILHGEPESQESYQWLPDLMNRQIDEFLDLNAGEKAFMKIWNEFIIQEPAYGSEMLASRLMDFVKKKGELIASRGLYRNFILHLTNLCDHEVLEMQCFMGLVLQQQNIMRSMKEKPWFDQWRASPSKVPPLPPPVKHRPPPIHSRPLPSVPSSSRTTKKAQKRRRREPKPRRESLRRQFSTLKTRPSDVSVKFWGPGDYISIKDIKPLAPPQSMKRKHEFEDTPMIKCKRRKTSSGRIHLNHSSSTEVT